MPAPATAGEARRRGKTDGFGWIWPIRRAAAEKRRAARARAGAASRLIASLARAVEVPRRGFRPGRRPAARRSTDAAAPKSMDMEVSAAEPSRGVGADGLLAWRRRLHQKRDLEEKMRLDTTPLHGGGGGARQPGARAAELYM